MNKVELFDLGNSGYQKTWDLQKRIQQCLIVEKLKSRNDNRYRRKFSDVLLLVEHPHVFTIGKSGNMSNLLAGNSELEKLGAEFIKNDRGGDITYHGPGQIVAYPILDLDRHFTDIHKYLRFLEEVIIRVCESYGFNAGRIDGLTGVWVDGKKICAMGIRCSRWVTMHGFALNVNTNLRYFSQIIPCGIRDKSVTSLSELTGKTVDPGEVKRRILNHFADVFSIRFVQGAKLPESEEQFS